MNSIPLAIEKSNIKLNYVINIAHGYAPSDNIILSLLNKYKYKNINKCCVINKQVDLYPKGRLS